MPGTSPGGRHQRGQESRATQFGHRFGREAGLIVHFVGPRGCGLLADPPRFCDKNLA
jgi:hypothetical protein